MRVDLHDPGQGESDVTACSVQSEHDRQPAGVLVLKLCILGHTGCTPGAQPKAASQQQ